MTTALEKIKVERKRISDSISVDRKNLEDLQKQNKLFLDLIEEQNDKLRNLVIERKSDEESVQSLKSNIDKLNVELTEVNKKVVESKRRLGLDEEEMRKNYNEKVGSLLDEISKKEKIVVDLSIEISKLEINKKEIEKDVEKLSLQESNAEKIFQQKTEKQICFSEETDEKIKQKEESLLVVNSELSSAKIELDRIKIKAKEEFNILSKLKSEREIFEEESKKIQGRIDSEIKKKTSSLDAKEKALSNKEENLSALEKSLDFKEKRIERLGATLQKHFNKQNMPIKVFE